MKKITKVIALLIAITMMFNNVEIFRALNVENVPEVIIKYVNYLNNGEVENITGLLHQSEKEEFLEFISNTSNTNEHIGIFNYKKANIISCQEYEQEAELLGYKAESYEGVSELSFWECIIDVETYQENNYLLNGQNRFVFVLGLNQNDEQIIVGIIRDKLWSEINNIDENVDDGISTLSYDAPVSPPSTGTWTTPSTIVVQSYGTLNFKEYCKVVTVNEFGTDSFSEEARKACALAIKNVGWNRTLVQKYSNYGYDVKPTEADMVYNPSKEVTTNVTNAVNAIWGYVMLSCDYKLFCAFFVNSVSDNSYARYHGGMLSHVEANSLGNNGYSWQQILHYFYDYGTYNSEMTSGVIKIVALNHTQSVSLNYESNIYYHWKTCTICGCAHTKTAHTWVAQSGNGYTCSVCGMFSQNIVARDVQESVTY